MIEAVLRRAAFLLCGRIFWMLNLQVYSKSEPHRLDSEFLNGYPARVAKLADARDLKSRALKGA